jgi:phage/plasmid-like protein (TIGR03299 family)
MAKNQTFQGVNFQTPKTLDEACKTFGFDFTPEAKDIYFEDEVRDEDGNIKWDDGRMVTEMKRDERYVEIVHGETRDRFDIVGAGYVIVPYKEAFDFADDLLQNGWSIIGGLALNKGEKAYMLLEDGQQIPTGPNSAIVNRITLMSSHDGSGKIEIRSTPSCTASGVAITTDASHPLSFKHTRNVNQRLQRANKVLASVTKTWGEFSASAKKMQGVAITDDQARKFIEDVIPAGAKESTRLDNIHAELFEIYKFKGIATKLPQTKGTLFGIVMAVCEWSDGFRTVRASSKRDPVSAALESKLTMDGARKKSKAWGLALYLAKGKGSTLPVKK